MLKILIIDDEAPIRKWLAFCVEQIEGFSVVGYGKNGLQGIEMTNKLHPDIIITDIEMPGMTGTQMLKLLTEQGGVPYVIVLTSYESFQYARDSFQFGSKEYILKTEMNQEKLREALLQAKSTILKKISDEENRSDELARKWIRQLLREEELNPVTEEKLRSRGIYLENKDFIAIDIYCIKEAVHREIREHLSQEPNLYHSKYIGYDEEHTILLANLHDTRTFHNIIERCSRRFPSLSGAIGFSDCKESFFDFPSALREAQERCSMSFYEPEKSIFWDQPVGIRTLIPMEHWRVSFSKELFAQHYGKAISIKNQILEEIKEKKPAEVSEVKKLCSFLSITLLYFTVDESDELEKKVLSIEKKIQSVTTFDELAFTVDLVFLPFQQRIQQNKTYSEAVQGVLSYIHENYHQKISLASAASYVSFSPEHISRMFVRETGMNFVTYLNNVRMKHAVELLEQTSKKIYEIAEEVGYPSVSYFSSVFKKTFGQTPNEYQSHR